MKLFVCYVCVCVCVCTQCVHTYNTTHIVLHNGTKVEGNWWDDCLDTSGCSWLAHFHIMWWSLNENLCSIICYALLLHHYVLGFLMCCILLMRILCGMFLFFLHLCWKRMLLQCCSIIVLMPHGPSVSSIVLFSTFTSLCERNDTKSLWYFPKHAKLNSLLPFICTEE